MNSLIVIPTYNEKRNLEFLIPAIFNELPQTHVVFVDDNSQDGTAAYIKELQATNSKLHLIERPSKLGLGSAYICGFQWALKNHYDFIFEMDADLSHQPKYLPHLLKAAQSNDLVLGSRYVAGGGVENWNFFRRQLSRWGSFYSRVILSLPYSDLTGGFKCFKRKVLEAILLDEVKSNGYCFQIELTYRAHKKGFKIVEEPIIFTERTIGKSNMSKTIILEALWRVPFLRFS